MPHFARNIDVVQVNLKRHGYDILTPHQIEMIDKHDWYQAGIQHDTKPTVWIQRCLSQVLIGNRFVSGAYCITGL